MKCVTCGESVNLKKRHYYYWENDKKYYQCAACGDKESKNEFCNECGADVKYGHGNFVNRVPDLNSVADRKAMSKPYPYGDYVCAECDEKYTTQHPF